ncbi:MAG: hypothetical protein ACM3SY_09220 [Candidatus Omnitrophota bacterium]
MTPTEHPEYGDETRKRNFKRILKYLLIGLFLLLQIFVFFINEYDTRDDIHYVNEVPLPMDATQEVSQEFRTPGPLSRIDVMLADYKTKPGSGILRLSIFTLSKTNQKDNQCLFLKNYPANAVDDNRFYSFPIDSDPGHPIPAGHYLLKLRHFTHNPYEKLAAWTSVQDLYPYGSLLVNGQKQRGDLTFRVYFRSSIWGQRHRWLHPIPGYPLPAALLAAGFLLLLFMVNFLFYYFINKLTNESRN